MKAILNTIKALSGLLAFPAFAEPQDDDNRRPSEPPKVQATVEDEVKIAVRTFFRALRSPDKAALARTMDPRGTIFIHDRRNPQTPKVIVRSVKEHLEGWMDSPSGTDERMQVETLLINGDMAQVWGPYVFLLNGNPTHCGINSLSMVKTESGWTVANTSFTMVQPSECAALGAPETGE